MVPGATETSRYFEVTVRPETFNSALALRRRGYSTLTLDRLGTRGSGKPNSRQVTTVTQAAALHRVIAAARAGELGANFSTVLVYGHSIGSMIAVSAQALTRDPAALADGLILTGYAHAPAAEPIIGAIYAGLIPEAESIEVRNDGDDPGYLTGAPVPAPEAIPDDIAAYIREVMDRVSNGEADGPYMAISSALTRLIEVPVYLGIGSEDIVFCGPLAPGNDCSTAETIAATEQPEFPNAASFHAFVLTGAPHELQMDAAAPRLSADVATWIQSEFAS